MTRRKFPSLQPSKDSLYQVLYRTASIIAHPSRDTMLPHKGWRLLNRGDIHADGVQADHLHYPQALQVVAYWRKRDRELFEYAIVPMGQEEP
jgi:hypothetical protein